MAKFTRKKRPSVEIGQIFSTSHGECKVIAYTGYDAVTVEFSDGYTKETQVSQLKTGKVRNPYFKSVLGIGFLGEGVHPASDENGSTPAYRVWISMLARCYHEKQQIKQPSYIGVIVCEEWHNFQNFAEWYENNRVEGWVLDKDLLSGEDKIYSPNTCCFVPVEINSFLTNRRKSRGQLPVGVTRHRNKFSALYRDNSTGKARTKDFDTPEEAFAFYKQQKEVRAKMLAEKYKDTLSDKAITALINYQININD